MQTVEGTAAFIAGATVGTYGLCAYLNVMLPGAGWLGDDVLKFGAMAAVAGAVAETVPAVRHSNADNILIPASTVAVAVACGMLRAH